MVVALANQLAHVPAPGPAVQPREPLAVSRATPICRLRFHDDACGLTAGDHLHPLAPLHGCERVNDPRLTSGGSTGHSSS